jgi:hypothetical protein
MIPAAEGPGGRRYPEQSIANFNKAPDPWALGDQSVGKLPQGTPDTFPDAKAPELDDRLFSKVDWNQPRRRK